MQKFSEFRPTQHDQHIAVEGREDWLRLDEIILHPNLDEVHNESNFAVACKLLEHVGEKGEDWDVLSFNHWGTPFEIIVVRPGTFCEYVGEEIDSKLSDYPILDEDDYCEREWEAAAYTWEHCYTTKQRIEYMRGHRSQFEYGSFDDAFVTMLKCARGLIFCGSAGELLN